MRKTFHNPNYFTLIMVQWKTLPDCGPENLSLDIVLGYDPIYEWLAYITNLMLLPDFAFIRTKRCQKEHDFGVEGEEHAS